jgi:valyl-tRNA synthetase
VKPERAPQKANANPEAERDRLRGEIARSEKLLANDRFVANAKPEVVDAEREKLERYRRELDAIAG